MANKIVQSRVLDYNDILRDIQAGQTISLKSSLAFSPDIVDFQDSTVSIHSHDSILTYLNLSSHETNRLQLISDNYIDLIFLFEGLSSFRVGDLSPESGRNSVILILNAPKFSIVKAGGSKKRGIHFKVRPDVLIGEYGLAVDAMPAPMRDAILGASKQPLTLKAALPARSRVALIDIYECKMQGTLFTKYMRAKTDELLCETVSALNGTYQADPSRGLLGAKQKLEQRIEAAAHLYRQRMGHAPTIDATAQMLGLNRNNLHDGFKEMFGVSPAEYRRTHTLEWAREQLAAGSRSVKEVAALAGYSGMSAFSRAFSGHFGTPPSSARRGSGDDPTGR